MAPSDCDIAESDGIRVKTTRGWNAPANNKMFVRGVRPLMTIPEFVSPPTKPKRAVERLFCLRLRNFSSNKSIRFDSGKTRERSTITILLNCIRNRCSGMEDGFDKAIVVS